MRVQITFEQYKVRFYVRLFLFFFFFSSFRSAAVTLLLRCPELLGHSLRLPHLSVSLGLLYIHLRQPGLSRPIPTVSHRTDRQRSNLVPKFVSPVRDPSLHRIGDYSLGIVRSLGFCMQPRSLIAPSAKVYCPTLPSVLPDARWHSIHFPAFLKPRRARFHSLEFGLFNPGHICCICVKTDGLIRISPSECLLQPRCGHPDGGMHLQRYFVGLIWLGLYVGHGRVVNIGNK
ncbi:hypothetical protein GYMLUDRAFT_357048 [Collybiopsis luxurians FD-317 M1]|nr:hypothetical protein GYMLUDRAFT_357048 [Collybiopsis luxurians FD-317 M1]